MTWELHEAKAEIARHHHDFELIRHIVYDALELPATFPDIGWEKALKDIRRIVG